MLTRHDYENGFDPRLYAVPGLIHGDSKQDMCLSSFMAGQSRDIGIIDDMDM